MICDSPDSPHSNFQPYTSLTLLRLSLDAPYLFRLEPRASELRCSLADFTQIISWCRSRFLFSWKRRRFVYAVASIEDLQTPRSPTSSKGPSPLFIRLQPFLKIIKIRSKMFPDVMTLHNNQDNFSWETQTHPTHSIRRPLDVRLWRKGNAGNRRLLARVYVQYPFYPFLLMNAHPTTFNKLYIVNMMFNPFNQSCVLGPHPFLLGSSQFEGKATDDHSGMMRDQEWP